MQHHNPLCEATHLHNILLDMQSEMMFEIAGEAAFEPFDEELAAAVDELIYKSADAVTALSPRARHARLNAIWKDFVAIQRQKKVAI